MAGTAVVVSLTGETDAAAGFYIPLAPPLSQKIFLVLVKRLFPDS